MKKFLDFTACFLGCGGVFVFIINLVLLGISVMLHDVSISMMIGYLGMLVILVFLYLLKYRKGYIAAVYKSKKEYIRMVSIRGLSVVAFICIAIEAIRNNHLGFYQVFLWICFIIACIEISLLRVKRESPVK